LTNLDIPPDTLLPELPAVAPLERGLEAALREKIDHKTKPPGSLGRLEALALQLGLIQSSLTPVIARPTLIVFAGDHGIVAEGVSPYPQAVTVQMVANFVAAGTRNFADQPAMTREQALRAITAGAVRARHHAGLGSNVIGFGEMGIGNTSSAACLMSRLCDLPIDACVGRGTGLDDAGLARKRAVLAGALARHPASIDPVEVLATFGGFEIAMMTGAFLGAAAQRMTILVDGFIASSALLVAARIAPAVLDYCVFAHQSDEAGHQQLLAHFKAQPLLSLGLRLGEGTGAALTLPLLRAASAFMEQMASFDTAGVSGREA